MNELFANFVNWLVIALSFAIFGRVIMSWISPKADDPLTAILVQLTEPILAPIRRYMPKTGMFDLTPMVALLILNIVIRPVILTLLQT